MHNMSRPCVWMKSYVGAAVVAVVGRHFAWCGVVYFVGTF